MFKVFRRLRFLKLSILAVLGVQITVFFAVCIVHQLWYISFVRNIMGFSEYDNDTMEAFLWSYDEYCQHNLTPKVSNIVHLESWRRNVSLPLCTCIPKTLIGRSNVTFDAPPIGELELAHGDLLPGGSWSPYHCISRQRIAIIVPFRDREEHLRMLLNILHPMLQRQTLHYTIFVVEQQQPSVFNKASLMNVGFIEARALADFDCFIFHDVDMLPEDDRNFYVCSPQPRHVGSHINKWNYEILYRELFGGVTAFRREHFERTNGFSNEYYGWGGEDDDMYNRIKAQNMSVVRFSKEVARFSMVKHRSDVGNPYNIKSNVAWKLRPKHYMVDGLSSLRYRIVSTENRPLYTWLLVSLPPHPSYFKGSYRELASDAKKLPSVSVFSLTIFPIVFLFAASRLSSPDFLWCRWL